ncbi:hypothetical protein JTE90_003896 [Oedothorax gibbosus]|uniref:Antistasin-like domain-containing protein n=1 Tax=Oedothorax gibbosus TaxID=931172 RepID=A0AAV6UIG9_9ARAC|nr:hypothetical protein JTE90_003896 [Oedothorax gibbosus]
MKFNLFPLFIWIAAIFALALAESPPLCSPPKCEAPCRLNYDDQPCPSCECVDTSPPKVQCSPPKCEGGCSIDSSTIPCPSCKCGGSNPESQPQCSPPKCDAPCQLNYDAKPCPSCECEVPPPKSMLDPNCGPDCSMIFDAASHCVRVPH